MLFSEFIFENAEAVKEHPSKRALVGKPTYCIYPSHEGASHENAATITELVAIKIVSGQPFKYDIWYLEKSRKLSTSLLKTLTPIYSRRIISKVCKWDFFSLPRFSFPNVHDSQDSRRMDRPSF